MKTTAVIARNEYPTVFCPLWWQTKGLRKTITGFGRKIETEYKTNYMGYNRRIYLDINSNSGVTYVIVKGKRVYVDLYHNS